MDWPVCLVVFVANLDVTAGFNAVYAFGANLAIISIGILLSDCLVVGAVELLVVLCF